MDDSHTLRNPDPGRLASAKHANSNRTKTRVLGRSRLQAIWDDMERTTLPSWCSPAPPQIGDKGQGKISADAWCVFCTVHLIMTLGHLWGCQPAGCHENKLFVNFCDLIAATKIASGRSISIAHTKDFRDLMVKYLSGLDNLFPMYQLIPYHHIVIHLREYCAAI